MKVILTMFVILAAALAGCATRQSNLAVEFNTSPQSALLLFSGGQRSTSPATFYFEPTAEFRAGGCMVVERPVVYWKSGVEVARDTVRACASNGLTQQVTIQRPNAPGLHEDVAWHERTQREIAAIERAGDVAATVETLERISGDYGRGGASASRDRYYPSQALAPSPSYRCTSRRSGMFGDQVRTDCLPQ